MWEIDNKTEFAVGGNWVRDEDGHHQWIVVIKGTFGASSDGTLRLAEEQRAPALLPEYLGTDSASSLRADLDFGLLKPETDVVIVGQAHAPSSRPAPEVVISLRMGALSKDLLVRGDSVFRDGPRGLTTTTPAPFITMPVVYERAFGGTDRRRADPTLWETDKRNPLGRGYGCHGPSLTGLSAPNVVYPASNWSKPAGFGAICSYWSPRLELGGTYDNKWKEQQYPLLPRDFDRRSLLISPPDQRPGCYLQGGETISIINMNPRGLFYAKVPSVRFKLTSAFGFRMHVHHTQLVTVLLEPERDRVTCVWQSSLKVASPMRGEHLDTTTVEKA